MSNDTVLADRYGRSSQQRGFFRRNLVVIILTSVLVIGLIIWASINDALGFGPRVETRDLAFSDLTASSVTVSFELTATPGNEVACALQALNEQFAIVGWKVFVYPASDQRIREFTETIQTSQLPTTGLVYQCWLT